MGDLKTIFSLVSIVLTALVVIVVFFRTRGGMKRGAYRQPIHFAGVLITSIISFLVVTIGCRMILDFFKDKEMSEIFAILESDLGINLGADIKDTLSSFDAEVISYFLVLPLAFVSPILFMLIYIVVSIFVGSARVSVVKFCKIPRRIDTAGKTIGGILGAVEGVLFMAIMLLPLTALLRIGVPVIQKIDVENETANEIFDAVEEVYEAPVIQLVSYAGGDFLANELSTVTLDGNKINLANEMAVGAELANQIIGFMEDGGTDITPARERSIRNAVNLLRESDYLPILLSGAMNIVADSLDEFIPSFSEEDDIKDLVDKLTMEIGDFLRESKPETVVDDIETFVDLFLLLNSSDMIDKMSDDPDGAFADFVEKDEDGKTLISKMIAILSSNERTKAMIGTLNEMSLTLMFRGMGVEGDTAEVYEELKGSINNVVQVDRDSFETEEEYKAELKTEIKGTITTTLGNIIDGKVGDKEINIDISEEDKSNLQEIIDKIETGDEESEEIISEVTDKVDEFLQQNPDITADGELDDAEILDFITSNFGDMFAEGGFPGFGGGSQQGESQQGGNATSSTVDN